jgi:hypothetical protein
MRDIDIRLALLNDLKLSYRDERDTRIVEEFGLCEGKVRIDVAVVNGMLSGFEIKSDKDTLERLPLQERIYSQVFDKIIIVVGKAHSYKVTSYIPDWWGIWQSKLGSNGTELDVLREPRENLQINPQLLVQCLWHEEALKIINERNLDKRLLNKRRSIMWEELVKNVPLDELKTLVRNHLKARAGWRSRSQPLSDDGLSQLQSIPQALSPLYAPLNTRESCGLPN